MAVKTRCFLTVSMDVPAEAAAGQRGRWPTGIRQHTSKRRLILREVIGD